jgi:hypothetical protein
MNDKTNRLIGWKLNSQTIQQTFEYRDSDELDSYFIIDDYESYVYEFRCRLSDIRSNLSLLDQFEWINRQTRAVIIQFNLYNPNMELFTSITFAEFLLTNVGIYVWRYNQSKCIGDLFKETNGYVLIYLISFFCLFGTIRLCRFNRRFSLFIERIEHGGKDFLSFVMMFSIVFVAFLCLLFISKHSTCSSLFQTAEMILMKFDAYELIDTCPFCFSLFIFLVVFIYLKMFIMIINNSFRFVHDHVKHQRNKDEQIFGLMFRKFRCWIGM